MTPNPTTKPNPPQEPTRDAPCPALTTEAMKKTILVVDDDEQIRESLCKVLRAEGYDVLLAANGQEGIGILYTVQFDLLLLDVTLPDISGWELFGTLTSINPFLPIIIITGRNEQYELAMLGGVGAFVEKPLDIPLLLEKVKELLEELPENHLQRLAGRHRDTPYLSPRLRPHSETSSSPQTEMPRQPKTIPERI
jgi:DNA-binding response OmpR family regulator